VKIADGYKSLPNILNHKNIFWRNIMTLEDAIGSLGKITERWSARVHFYDDGSGEVVTGFDKIDEIIFEFYNIPEFIAEIEKRITPKNKNLVPSLL
jgi:hypothetical protein